MSLAQIFTRLKSSKAARPPATSAKMYGRTLSMLSLPAAAIMMVTAGLKQPPEMGPPNKTAIAKAAPMASALPVAMITYRKNNVPINSTRIAFIIQ